MLLVNSSSNSNSNKIIVVIMDNIIGDKYSRSINGSSKNIRNGSTSHHSK